jgi:hypothetical protein
LKPDGQANSGKVKIENAGTKYENVPPWTIGNLLWKDNISF